MRICIVVDQFPKLSETFVLAQVEGLSARGHEVEVLCNGSHDDLPVRARVRHHWGPLAAFNRLAGMFDVRVRHKMRALLDRLDAGYLSTFDVIVAHFGYEGARVAATLRHSRTAPPLATIYHGHDVSTVAHDGAMWIYQDLFQSGALHLPVNASFCQTLIDAGAPPERTRVHHVGISPDIFAFSQRDWTARPLRILSVARLTEKKGISCAISALERVAKDHPDIDWQYDIVGTGELEDQLHAQAEASPVSGRIRFRGALPHGEVRHLLSTAHIFLLPSVSAANGDTEGVPVSLMEAMASGAIVVSTVHSGIPELIEDGVTGYLAPERDVAALARKLATAATSPDADRIAAGALRTVRRDFNAKLQLGELEQMLEELHAGSGHRRDNSAAFESREKT